MANKRITDLPAGGAILNTDAFVIARTGTSYQVTGIDGMALQSPSSVVITGGTITGITDLTVADGGTGSSTASGARTNLGLAIGTDIQGFDQDLSALAALSGTGIAVRSASNTWVQRTLTGTANQVIISDGDGVAANPTFTLPQSIATSSTPTFGGLILSGALNESKGADIASASTTDIGAATGNYLDVTGTVTITALGTVQAGTRRVVRFTGILTLTHNATSLILPTGANITTAAGDCAEFISLGSGNWRNVVYQRADGTALAGGSIAASQADQEAASSTSVYVSPGRQHFHPSAAKFWVIFTSVTTTTISASYNVTSLTDNATGDTTVNFTTSFSSANYAVNASAGNNSSTGYVMFPHYTTTTTASLVRCITTTVGGTPTDIAKQGVTGYGDI